MTSRAQRAPLGTVIGWECPCGKEPPRRGSNLTPELTVVSLREPRCPFCGSAFREQYRITNDAADERQDDDEQQPQQLGEVADLRLGRRDDVQDAVDEQDHLDQRQHTAAVQHEASSGPSPRHRGRESTPSRRTLGT